MDQRFYPFVTRPYLSSILLSRYIALYHTQLGWMNERHCLTHDEWRVGPAFTA